MYENHNYYEYDSSSQNYGAAPNMNGDDHGDDHKKKTRKMTRIKSHLINNRKVTKL